jgi:hypothetical protein
VGPIVTSLNDGKSAGTYVGFGVGSDVNPQDLTAAGTTDWRIWGRSTTALGGDDRKAGGAGISNLTNIDADPSTPLRALGTEVLAVGTGASSVPFSFSWSDGTPSSNSGGPVRGGLQHNAPQEPDATPGDGFSFTVPATAATQRLRVWVSAHHGTGKLTATLGGTLIDDTSVSGGQNRGGIYTLDFTGDGSEGQVLNVSYVLSSVVPSTTNDEVGLPSNSQNVVIYAAALSDLAPAADFTIGATPSNLTIVQGFSDQSTINTTQVGSAGSVGLSAVVAPADQGVSAVLASPVAAGSSAALTVSAAPNATPGAYTVTVTGTEGAKTHQAVVNVAVAPATGAPVLFRATPTGSGSLGLTGLLHGSASTSYNVRLLTSASCPGGVLGTPTALATVPVVTDGAGDSYFGGTVPVTGTPSTYIAAQVVPPGNGSPVGPCAVVSPDNDSWVRALDIAGTGAADGYIDAAGRGRWYKFTVQPGARLTITLANLPADYDLFLFKDIGAAYNTLTNTDNLNQLSAEFAPSAFSPSAFSPSAFSPSAFSPSAFSPSAFSPSAFSPSVYSPSAFSPSAFSPSAFSPSAFSPSAFSPSAFSPSAFSPSAFSPSAFSPSAFSPSAFSSAQTRSLIGVSAGTGTGNETIVADTWTNTGSYYVLVGGKNGASSLAQPFHVSVTSSGNTCTGVAPTGSLPAAPDPHSLKTLIVADTSRIAGTATEISALKSKLSTLAARPEVSGAWIDLADSTYSQVHSLNAQADGHRDCVYAKNLVADAIKGIVDQYRDVNPALASIVLVGGDRAIPFFRYPDQSLLGPESDYVPPVDPQSASEAALRANYVLGQDQYGASKVISLGSIDMPVPDLAVGRLVETAAEASGLVDAYLATAAGVTATPTSSLVTGYDFLADAATSVAADLGAGTGRTVDTLITPNNVAPTAGWTANQLRTSLLGARHDLIFLAGHFSANNALAADFSTTVNATEVVGSSTDFTNSIVFSAGCHSGYNVIDSDALTGVTQTLDWAQAFAQKKATLIAGTGYQYGDTDFLEYSERIYAEFAHQLRIGPNSDGSGPVSVGQALVRAKQTYLSSTPDIRGLHQKALLESALFGLPMLSVNLPAGRIAAGSSSSIVTTTTGFPTNPGQALGLRSQDITLNPSTTAHTVNMSNLSGGALTATYYSGRDGVVTNPGEPAIPLQSENVSVPGKVLRGVGFLSGEFTDSSVVPLTGAPNTEIRGVHTAFSSTAFFPMRPWTVNYYDALATSGGSTRLLVTPAQHRVANVGDQNATLRLYGQLGLRLFYSSYIGEAAQSAAPTISGVTGNVTGSTIAFTAHVVGNPAAGIQQVWITFTGNGDATGRWTSLPLVQDGDDSTLWTATMPLPTGTTADSFRFMIQAANGVGLVSLDDNLGAFYGVAGPTTAPADATTITLGAVTSPGAYGTTLSASATLKKGTSTISGKPIVFTLGTVTRTAVTSPSGVAAVSIPLTSAPGPYTLTAAFPGEATLLASSDAANFTIAKQATTLTLAPPNSSVNLGLDSGVVATLVDGNGAPLSFRTVFFVLSGPASRTSAAITDFAGRARLGTLPPAVGPYTVVGCFGSPSSPVACTTVAVPDGTYGSASGSATVTQTWPFTGFLQPVDNTLINTATAGQAIPVKFQLGGNRGLAIFKNGYPAATITTCASGASDAIEETVTANASGLQYDATSNTYTYVWKTDKAKMSGKCVTLDLGLIDGSSRTARFKLK